MLIFLETNGYRIEATEPELAEWMIGLGGGLTPEQFVERICPLLIAVTSR